MVPKSGAGMEVPWCRHGKKLKGGKKAHHCVEHCGTRMEQDGSSQHFQASVRTNHPYAIKDGNFKMKAPPISSLNLYNGQDP